MHEQSIVESMVAIALENAQQANASKILKIYLVVGELSGVLDDAVNFYFGFLTRDTIAAGASISFEHVRAQFRCRSCNTVFLAEENNFQCPNCKGQQVEIVSGRELYIDRMEVE
jgi:hydrogenase nickel incorporation protein HypA/HybF